MDQVIHYSVDDEPQTTTSRELTPTQILQNAHIDPATHYLVELDGKHQKPFKDNPNEAIHMHDHLVFISIFNGPTTVS